MGAPAPWSRSAAALSRPRRHQGDCGVEDGVGYGAFRRERDVGAAVRRDDRDGVGVMRETHTLCRHVIRHDQVHTLGTELLSRPLYDGLRFGGETHEDLAV